jgi:dTDP-4-dehydrorhamnose 3,5-epimerase
MIFTETPLEGVFVVDVEPHEDERGSFARTFCSAEFERHGLRLPVSQCNVSYNTLRGTLRGMHYQAEPHGEAKLVRCTSGAIFDVVVDLRARSKTYCRWFGVDLTAGNRRMLYVPDGLAHGFQTLADESEVFYVMSAPYVPEAFRGVRFDDPAFGISWPEPVRVVSARDREYEDFRP